MVKTTFNGFDDFNKKLKRKVEEASGPVSLETLFNERFMSKYAKIGNINEFFEKSPFTLETEEDFSKIDEAELDKYTAENTLFTTWEQMKAKAAQEYMAGKLKF